MKMESEVNHLVTEPCPGLKQSRPNLSTHAPVTTSLLNWMDFLQLEQSSGGY